MSTDLHVEHLLELTDEVTERFNQKKVILIGHSFGTYIGLKAAEKAPDKFSAYIGIGQVANALQSEIDSLEYTILQAKLQNNRNDIEKLEKLRRSIEDGKELTPRSLVRKYGGAARLINDNLDYYTGFLFNPEYNLLDVVRYLKGVSFSQDVLIREEREHEITKLVTKLDIPTYFVMGKFDYMTSANSAKSYFYTLEAPVKEFVLFDHSAHYPQFEEEEKFADWLYKTSIKLNEKEGKHLE